MAKGEKKEGAELVVRKPDISIEAVIQSAIDKGVPVETMERLLAMRRELKAEAAKESYDRAMAGFQSSAPTIEKTKEVKTRTGVVAYKYAPVESIIEQVKGLLQQYGFSYSFKQELKETGVKVTCVVTHELGHSEPYSMEVPFGSKTEIMSNSQVTAAASTFAKRYAFCNAFGILTGDEDTDGADVKAPERPKMAAYRVEKRPEPAQAQEPVIQLDEGNKVTEMKKRIVRRLVELDPLMDVKNAKTVKLEVEQRTSLPLTEDNYETIAERLQVLVDEKREALQHEADKSNRGNVE